jgi:hypothetical protein
LVAGGSCQEMGPAVDFSPRVGRFGAGVPGPKSSPARSALSCHPPEERLRPGVGDWARAVWRVRCGCAGLETRLDCLDNTFYEREREFDAALEPICE